MDKNVNMDMATLFENHPKCRIFQKLAKLTIFLAFLANFCPLKIQP